MKKIVFTLRSLGALLDICPVVHSILNGSHVPLSDVVSIELGGVMYVLHREDGLGERRIIVLVQEDGRIWPKEANQAERPILERMYALGERAERTPLRLPPRWGQYKYQSLVGFSACSQDLVSTPMRWVAEVQPQAPHDVCFWLLTTNIRRSRLEDFTSPEHEYEAVIDYWSSALDQADQFFGTRVPLTDEDGSDVELGTATFADITQNLSRTEWMSKLTYQQVAFVTQAVDHSIKLRGPAGTGKTLTLELKALHEIAEARKRDQSLRILFVTHSWALAEQVDDDISVLSEWGSPTELTILPLLAVAQEVLPTERQANGDLVGEDSLSGKLSQLQQIRDILDKFLQGDWLTFRDEVSDSLRARLESTDSTDISAFIWDCLIEFGCVLGADGIFPGINAELRYLRLPRTSWMMPLAKDADKRLILHLYEIYMNKFEENGQLTSDQLVNDFLNYLETGAWNLRRARDGYDLIFVDEFHLFNVQERHLLRYLARSRSEYPRIFMALDPKQSPWGVYSGLTEAVPTSWTGRVEDEFGLVSSIDLATTHRYSPEILNLVKHLDWEFPNLDLGADWGPDTSTITSSTDSGPIPVVVRCGSQQAEVIDIYQAIRAARASGGVRDQMAIAIVDPQKFNIYREMAVGLAKDAKLKLSVVASREDIEILKYRRRGVVVAPAEYLAGLQFDSVLIGGLPDIGTGIANLGYRRMRFLSLLYVAITRARKDVVIFVNDDYGGVPEILHNAADKRLVMLRVGRTV